MKKKFREERFTYTEGNGPYFFKTDEEFQEYIKKAKEEHKEFLKRMKQDEQDKKDGVDSK